jgi:hypothetical protein
MARCANPSTPGEYRSLLGAAEVGAYGSYVACRLALGSGPPVAGGDVMKLLNDCCGEVLLGAYGLKSSPPYGLNESCFCGALGEYGLNGSALFCGDAGEYGLYVSVFAGPGAYGLYGSCTDDWRLWVCLAGAGGAYGLYSS